MMNFAFRVTAAVLMIAVSSPTGYGQTCNPVVDYPNLICVSQSGMNVSPRSTYNPATDSYNVTWTNVTPGNPSAIITIQPLQAGINLGSVTINSVAGAPALNSVQLSILENPNVAGRPKFVNITGNISLNGQPSLNVSRIDITGAISGNIDAQRIGTGTNGILAEGNIFGDLTTSEKLGGPFATFPITLVRSVNGSILGDLVAAGRIDNVLAANGTIGTSGSPSRIECTLASGDFIGFVEAKSVYAAISTPFSFVTRVKTTGTGTNEGDFVGSINARRIAGGADNGVYGLDIARDLKATITLTGATTSDTNDEFVIGRSFPDGGFVNGVSNYRIDFPAGRLTRQIIINNNNVSGATATAQVKVGTIPLVPVTYPNATRGILGGGAYGKVPYMVHYQECDPSGAGDPGTPIGICDYHAYGVPVSSIKIDHYGAVGYRNATDTDWIDTLPSGTQGVIVERRLNNDCDCTSNCWTDVSANFTVAVDTSNRRQIIVTGPFEATDQSVTGEKSWLYRIRPVRTAGSGLSALRCRNLVAATQTATGPVVGDYTFQYLTDNGSVGTGGPPQ